MDLEISQFKAFHLGKVVAGSKTRSQRHSSAQHLLAKHSDVYSADLCPAVMMETGHFQTWLFRSGPFVLQRPVTSRNRVKSLLHKADNKKIPGNKQLSAACWFAKL